jgi:hypothetical protein
LSDAPPAGVGFAEWAEWAVFDRFELWYPDRVGGTVRVLQWIAAALAILSMAGCASPLVPDDFWKRKFSSYALPVWTTDGMYLVSGRSGALFLTPPPMDLGRYRAVMLDDIEISTKDRSRELTPAEEERLRGYFTRRLTHVFERNGWAVVDAPADDVLRARLAVREIDLGRSRRSHSGKIVFGSSSTRITIALELRDAAEVDRRVLYGDRRELPFGSYVGTDAISIRRVEDAFYEFSIDMRRRIKQAQQGKFPPPPPRPS